MAALATRLVLRDDIAEYGKNGTSRALNDVYGEKEKRGTFALVRIKVVLADVYAV